MIGLRSTCNGSGGPVLQQQLSAGCRDAMQPSSLVSGLWRSPKAGLHTLRRVDGPHLVHLHWHPR